MHGSSVTSTKNKFVQLALQETLRLAWESKGPQELTHALSHGLDITIAGDNDFYSQRAQVSTVSCVRVRLLQTRSNLGHGTI